MTTPNHWSALLAATASAWHGRAVDATDAAAQASAYPQWQRLVAASAPLLPMDSVPADFESLLIESAGHAPLVLRAGPNDRSAAGGDPLSLPLTEAAALLRRGEASSRELTSLALGRLKTLHAATNACVSIDDERALAEADRCDAALRAGSTPALLHGVPLAHKDLLYREGFDVGCGLQPRAIRSYAFTGTAPVLQRLEAAGAVNCGRLHMTELAFEPSGANEELGPCRNPWSLAHVTGGSSSGSAAVVAGRAVYAALGSDTGGSIRIPAALCGITGLKPTRGLVELRGAMPLSHSNDTLGPLARSAADCALLMQAIVGGGHTPEALLQTLRQRFSEVAGGRIAVLKGLRIGVPQRLFRDGVDAAVARALDQSLGTLSEAGAVLVSVPDLDWSAINMAGAMLTRCETGARLARLRAVGGVRPSLLARFEEGLAIPASVYVQLLEERSLRLREFLQTVMAGVDVLHARVCRIATPEIATLAGGGPEAATVRGELTVLNRPFNFLGVPSLALPCGFATPADGARLPVGFQLIGRPYADADLLGIGAAWQAVTGWHLATPG